jgi:diacylglycerol kinase
MHTLRAIDPLEAPEPGPPRRQRPWRERLTDAFRGVKLGMRGHSSFSVHFFFAALVVAAGIALQCQALEWCLLAGGMGLVLTAELFHSALVRLCQTMSDELRVPVLHIAAGAVLLASATAILVGSLIFLPKLAGLLGF